MNPKQTMRFLMDVHNDNRIRPILEAGGISYANWWEMNPESFWFTRFIRYHFPSYGDHSPKIRFYSVFGPQKTIEERFDGIKVFFSGENLEEYVHYPSLQIREVSEKVWHNRKRKFDDYGFGYARISLGFPSKEDIFRDAKTPVNENSYTEYVRFPLWIIYLTEPEDDLAAIRKRIRSVNKAGARGSCDVSDAKGVACIASHDFYGTRGAICDSLESAGISVQYAGKWRHNTDTLQKEFEDNKAAYLQSVRFNICPENTDSGNYVTEKLFDAFRAGVIPIYHGSMNNPEPGIINKDAVLFWDYEKDNTDVIERIQEMERNDDAYAAFLMQEKLTEQAADYIWDRMCVLRKLFGRYLL